MADEDPGAEVTRIPDELVANQTRINVLREEFGDRADGDPEMVELQGWLVANDLKYRESAARVGKNLDVS